MPCFPLSRLFLDKNYAIAFSGPHILVLDSLNGTILSSTSSLSDASLLSAVLKSGPVRCAAVDPTFTYLATSGDDKLLKLWEVNGLKLLNQRQLPKKSTAIEFTKDTQTVLVSDKFGDVFSYPIHYSPSAEKQRHDAVSSHENPSGGNLILGHVSILTTFLLSRDECYIITADRDEHIRVSWYPQGYVIEMYCLGHEKYISAIHIPSFLPSILISGGGDSMLKIWDWMSGSIQFEIPILDAVQPFIRVAARRRKDCDDNENENEPQTSKKGKKRGKEKKGKERATEDPSAESDQGSALSAEQLSASPQVLVIHKICTLEISGTPYIVFNAVGATALFSCPLKDGAAVQSIDLQVPVIDFSLSDQGHIWVLLDINWKETRPPVSPRNDENASTSLVRVLTLNSTGQFAEPRPSQLGSHMSLLATLNSIRLLATTNDLKKQDVYANLTWLPKYNERGAPAEGNTGPDNPEEQMTKRQLGRLKNKKAVLAKAQEIAHINPSTSASTSNIVRDLADPRDEEPNAKKPKSSNMEVDL
ncbi:hypothetical protein AMATHDRAFT_2753 [Amanita thiersii Skay4041]|uniref:Uncharacterized protein n=1 Tax=Amanita thiersii Skay4041 TaxID=703135 RepID=A0A2A9NRA2_9AGAR|nr:hypothetical protein AMATHDRAFT_2753 [Amanita thiersii Skay4041]